MSTGELTQVTTPSGGTLGWGYGTYTYAGSGLSYREVQTRQVSPSTGVTYSWNITRDNNPTLHASATVADLGALTSKVWTFGTAAGPFLGLSATYEERNAAGTALLHKDYTWAQDTALNVYTGTVTSTLDPGTTYAAQSKTVQVLDSYGNTVTSQVYDYGNLSSPARTYNYQYLTAYPQLYIRNRVASETMTAGGATTTLTTNTYDGSALTDRTALTVHDASYSTANLARGNLTRSVTPGAIHNTAYDIGGLGVSGDDGQGHGVTIQPAVGTNSSLPGAILPTGSINKQTNFTYSAGWMPASTTGPNGDTSAKTYDSFGRAATSTSPFGAITTYSYDYTQHTVMGVTLSALSGQIPLTARFERTTYDGFGRTVKAEAGDNGTGTTLSTVDTQYAPCACSPLGKMSQVSTPYKLGEAVVWTKYQYDASGRTTRVTAPDGVSVTAYAYQGNQTTVTDAAGKWKQYTTDAMGNLSQVTEPDPAGGANLVTGYSYDGLNHMTQVSMPRQQGTQTRTFTYDSGTQRLTAVQTPESGTMTYLYNPDGTVQSKTDAKGQITRYTYDGFQRVTQTDAYPAGASQPDLCQTATYNYDTATVLESGTLRNGFGRLTGMNWTSPSTASGPCQYTFAEEYAYTAWGQVFVKRMTVHNTLDGNVPPVVMEGTFRYDAEGRLSVFSTPYSAGDTVPSQSYTYDRDALGRAVDMYSGTSPQTTSLVTGVSYTGAGRMLGMTFGGYTETRQYNANQQMTRQTAGAAQGMDLTYTYGTANNGRVASATDNLSGEQVTYTYDQLNRLTQAMTNDAWGLSFGYDGFGNLTQQTRVQGTTAPSMSVTVDPLTNRITTAGYVYDASGNVTQTPDGMTYGYDVANRMVSNGAVYNPKNQRVFDGAYLYYYGVGGELLGKYQALWGSTTTVNGIAYTTVMQQDHQPNLYFNGRAIRLQGHGAFVMTDRLGSVRVNGNGQRMNYYPYGAEVGTETGEGRVKFGTYTRDSAGVNYADQRYYGAGTGRFLTPDPYRNSAGPRDPGSWNQYAYVGGDPINFKDPSGEKRVCVGPSDDETCWDEPDDPPAHGGGGGKSVPRDHNPDGPPQKTGGSPDYRLLTRAVGSALDALSNPDCYSLFVPASGFATDPVSGNILEPSAVLKGLYRGTMGTGDGGYGTIEFFNSGDASDVANTVGNGLRFNSDGPYYSTVTINLNALSWDWGYTSENVTTLLHELGHAMNKLAAGFGSQNSFEGDALSNSASQANTKKVQDTCVKNLKIP